MAQSYEAAASSPSVLTPVFPKYVKTFDACAFAGALRPLIKQGGVKEPLAATRPCAQIVPHMARMIADVKIFFFMTFLNPFEELYLYETFCIIYA
jgi:hypothetical protein